MGGRLRHPTNALVPIEDDNYEYYLVYGSLDGGDPDLYAYYEAENLLRPFRLVVPETSEEEIVEESLVKTVEFDGKQMDYTFVGKGHSGKNNGENGSVIIHLRGRKK